MTNEILLILRSMLRHRAIVVLIVAQIAIACAILGNGLNLVSQRYALRHLPTGLEEDRLVVLDVEVLQGRLDEALRDHVLDAVERIQSVRSTAYMNTLPFSSRGSTFKFTRDGKFERQVDGALYYGSQGFMDTVGARVIAGRGFRSEDFRNKNPNPLEAVDIIILSESLSRRLEAPPGSVVKIAGRSLTVIGIAHDVMKPNLIDPNVANNTAFVPSPPAGVGTYQIVVATRESATPEIESKIVAEAVRATPRTMVWSARRFKELRADYFSMDYAMSRLILGMGVLLALVVAAGIGGLSSYWIIRRYKQIAIRRALGARRGDIAWYFHIENLIITLTGSVFGFIGAIAVSELLTRWLTLPSVPIAPLLWGAVAMIIVGQLAVVVPVRRAVAVPPGALKVP